MEVMEPDGDDVTRWRMMEPDGGDGDVELDGVMEPDGGDGAEMMEPDGDDGARWDGTRWG